MNHTRTTVATVALARTDVPPDFAQRLQMAEVLASAGSMMPAHYRDDPGAVMAVMMHAQSLDISVWLAIQETYVVDGRVGMSAALMHALILRSGHKIKILSSTNTGCKLQLIRYDDPDTELFGEFTRTDAFTAGLLGKPGWEKYPTDLYFARALSRLSRRHARDVVLGFGYTREELESGDVIDGDVVDDGQEERASARLVDAVGELLAEAYACTTRVEVIAVGERAKRRGLMTQYTPDGRVLRDVLLEIHRGLPKPDGTQDDQVADVEVTMEVLVDEDKMPCGCDKRGFVAGGGHQAGCVKRIVVEHVEDAMVVEGEA